MIILKKSIALILALIMGVGLLAACGTSNGNSTPPESNQSTQQSSTPTQAPSDAPDTSKFIGEERAKQIALEKAGIPADGVLFDRIELDRDNGVWQYELDFRQGNTEYDVDIKADDGTIISYETDIDD